MTAMSKYVLIGGGGYLGACILRSLQKDGIQRVYVVVDPQKLEFPTIELKENEINYEQKSFLDFDYLESVLKGAETVFHLASIGHTGIVANDRKKVFDFNVEGTAQLLRICLKHKVKRFLYSSSVAVYFTGQPLDLVDEDFPLPTADQYLDYYSASKAEAEQMIIESSTECFKTTCLRLRSIYGPEDPNVTKKVADLIKNGYFCVKVSAHETESVSSGSSGVNCGNAFVKADQALQVPGGKHGSVYNILDAEILGQYEFWEPLVLALRKQPPTNWTEFPFAKKFSPFMEFVSRFFPSALLPTEPILFLLAKNCVPAVAHLFYKFNIPPLLTKFEFLIASTNNTYSIEKARNEIGYVPEPSLMPQVAEFYKKDYQNDESETQKTVVSDWTNVIFYLVILLLTLILLG